MGSCPSGEDLILKARKPYTITKPRERWTEEEHNRFLEAVKLYGRAWQRIEEHIGTKSAVQIRSHAQKFFTKLEKEALGKGVPVGQAHDIDIPPPRPKRKPANPYPIKTSLGAPTSSLVGTKDGNLVTSFSSLNLQNELPLGEPHRAGKLQKPKKIKDKGTYVEVLNLFQEASGASISSARKTTVLMPTALTNTHTFREFIPPSKETNDCTANDESSLTEQSKGNHNLCEVQCPHAKVVQQDITINKANHTEKCEPLLLNETEVTPYFPRDVPGQAVDGSTGTYIQTPTANMTVPTSKVQSSGGHGNFNCLSHLKQQANSPTPCSHQPFPVFNSLFTPFSNNQDVYKSFMNIPSALSSLIISTLIKNPAAYSAARLAASSWPCVDDYSADTLVGGFPARHMNPSPSLAVITAATVAAATAWWTSHGLLPYCPPFHPRFTFTHAPIIFPTMTPEAPKDTEERMEDVPRNHAWVDLRLLNPEQSKAVEMQSPASESPASSSSNSEESRGTRSHSSSSKVSGNEQKQVACSELNDPKGKTRKQLDRSSCGSNTPSGSEVETETLEKHGKSKELFNEAQLSHPSSEPVGSTGNVNDSWKEVSDEGWLAFQALFSREILPQSFPGHDSKNKMHPNNANEEGKQKSKKDTDTSLELELSSKAWSMSLDHPQLVKMEGSLRSDNNLNGIPSNRLVGHGKLNAHRMGFKPYKRCSMEAKESRAVKGSDQSEENRAKRICLKGDAST